MIRNLIYQFKRKVDRNYVQYNCLRKLPFGYCTEVGTKQRNFLFLSKSPTKTGSNSWLTALLYDCAHFMIKGSLSDRFSTGKRLDRIVIFPSTDFSQADFTQSILLSYRFSKLRFEQLLHVC